MGKTRIVVFLDFTSAKKLLRMKGLWSAARALPFEKGTETRH